MESQRNSLLKADFLIITALPEEYTELARYFGLEPYKFDMEIEGLRCHDFLFHSKAAGGEAGFYRIVIAESCGKGEKASAGAVTALGKIMPRYVILCGIGGGNPLRKVNLGDLIVSQRVIDYSTGAYRDGEIKYEPNTYNADPDLLKYAREIDNFQYEPPASGGRRKKIPRSKAGWKFHLWFGDVASGNLIAEDPEFFESKGFGAFKIFCTEMEAAGIAEPCYSMPLKNPKEKRPGFLVVRGISDLASSNRRTKWRETARKVAAAFVFELIRSGKVKFWDSNKAVDTYLQRVREEFQYIQTNVTLPLQPDHIEKEERALRLDAVYVPPNIELKIRKGEGLSEYNEEINKHSDQHRIIGSDLEFIMQQQDIVLNPEILRDVSLLEVFPKNTKTVIFGRAGSGKTTYIHWLMQCFNNALLGKPEELKKYFPDLNRLPPLPVRIKLRNLVFRVGKKEQYGKEDIWSLVKATVADTCETIPETECLEKLLLEEGAFLFDGFDEVGDRATQQAVLPALKDFAQHLQEGSWMLITSRPYAMSEDDQKAFRGMGFQIQRIADLNGDQIRLFIDRWYPEIMKIGLLEKSDLGEKMNSLKEAVVLPSIELLARIPLYLSLMVMLHATRESLPENRVALYDEIIDLSVQYWNWGKGGTLLKIIGAPGIQPEHIRYILEKIAFRTHESYHIVGAPTVIQMETIREAFRPILQNIRIKGITSISGGRQTTPLEEEEKILDGVLDYIENRAGLLIAISSTDPGWNDCFPGTTNNASRKSRNFIFPHRTFQEYLAACFLVRQENFISLATELACKDPLYWREVLIFAAKQADIDRGIRLIRSVVKSTKLHNRLPWPKPDSQDYQRTFIAAEQLLEIGEFILSPFHQQIKETVTRDLELCIDVPEEKMNSKDRIRAGRILGILGDKRKEILSADRMQFCVVPAGYFAMLVDEMRNISPEISPDQHEIWRKPFETQYLPEFFIGRFPVTISQYNEFRYGPDFKKEEYWKEAAALGVLSHVRTELPAERPETPWKPIELLAWNAPEIFFLENHPVTDISWFEALAYTRWLTDRWRKQFHLPEGWEVRLPKESEWEKAARGGFKLPNVQYRYLDTPEVVQWMSADRARKFAYEYLYNPYRRDINNYRPHPWGKFMPSGTMMPSAMGPFIPLHTPGCFPIFTSPYGAEEMYGSVMEWCQTRYYFRVGRNSDPEQERKSRENLEAGNDQRVVRGQITYPAFTDTPSCSVRHGCNPVRHRRHGMRCVIAKLAES